VIVSNLGDLYVTPGPELDARVDGGMTATAAFSVYAAQQVGSEPLMRVYYDLFCNDGVPFPRSHDELAAGMGRFNKAYMQGNQPIPELHWSGLGQKTTLVVEALDRLCPFQGVLSPTAEPTSQSQSVTYPPLVTPDQIRAASPNGELYVNGQGNAGTPRAIARACLDVSPAPAPAMEWSYDGGVETYGAPAQTTFQTWEAGSPTFDVLFGFVSTNEFAVGSLFNELWITWGDNSGGTSGRVTVTPKATATLDPVMFLHASMEVDILSTDRRYPQLVLADQGSPASLVIVQTRGGLTGPFALEIQFCDSKPWDEGGQCPRWDLHTLDAGSSAFLAPHPEMNGLEGVDRTVLFDVYASTGRVYVSLNGLPYACVDLPTGRLMQGTATVTFADVLLVSSQDFQTGQGTIAPWFPFHVADMFNLTSRHFSNLAFSSQVSAPAWDETVLPCVPATGLH
jgi:hypothetical protein